MSPDVPARLALLSLPGIGPARLSWLLTGGTAPEVMDELRRGRLPATVERAPAGVTSTLIRQWTKQLRDADGARLLARNEEGGDQVLHPGHEQWPFGDDPEPPGLLFARGRLQLLTDRPLVAIVGTRRCSTIGRRVAVDLGRQLTEAGVGVVSGLASGIDGAAHGGVLSVGGAPLGVVGTGLDVIYPAVNRELWRRVGSEGLLLSEALSGTKPERWRFPARNRLIAALAALVVVVESHAIGGSLHTVSSAIERGRQVMAVPGSVTSSASVGSNQLLADGCAPVTGAHDILDALALSGLSGQGPSATVEAVPGAGTRSELSAGILRHVSAGAQHVDELLIGNRATVPEVLAAVQELVADQLVVLDGSMVSLRQQPPL